MNKNVFVNIPNLTFLSFPSYNRNCKRDDNMTSRVNDKDAERLWTVSMQLLGLAEEEEEEKMK